MNFILLERKSGKSFLSVIVFFALMSAVSGLFGDFSDEISIMKNGKLDPFRRFNIWIATLVFPSEFIAFCESKFGDELGYYILLYTRDIIAGSLVYWITAAIWHYVIYYVNGKHIFTDKKRPFPTTDVMIDQMMLAQSSLFLYAALPVLSEWLIENKLTCCYYYMDEIGGWLFGALYLFIYIACVEIGIYWMHRTLHTNKFLYKHVHAMHHKYNKASTLTPWASIAFHPLDGILQACPYVICLLFVPVNYYMHMFLLFFSGVWATNIHDSVPADSEPFMGAKYHTYHHTHYHYNYGQFFIFCDHIWGTLKLPDKSL